MTTVTPQRTASPRHRNPRLATALGIALLIAGMTIGLLLAFSGGGTVRPAVERTPTGTTATVSTQSTTIDGCSGRLRGPC